ncbi:MAG: lysylphosphatidylglycerol synthase transmembrane domain-containing protein [Anaerolineae bacterium]|jgi:uncharacterized protein (TIRG00374 family)
MRGRLIDLVRITVSLAGLVAVLLTQDLNQVLQLLTSLDWLPFVISLLLFLLGSFVRAYRWGSLVWALGIKASWARLTGLFFVGTFYNLFLPTGLGGDAVKMYELSREDGDAASAVSSVLVDRFLGLFILLAMALLVLAGSHQLVRRDVRAVIVIGFFGCLLGVLLLLQRTWIEGWGRRLGLDRLLGRFKILRQLYGSIHLYGTAALARATMASVVWNLILILVYYLIGLSVGVDLSIGYYLLFVPVISVLLVVPSVGGLGIREGATVLLFSRVGVSETQALALALAYDVLLVASALIGGVIYIRQGLAGLRRR